MSSIISRHLLLIVLLFLSMWTVDILCQECHGGAITSKESFLYGRFEVAMQSAKGSGIVSSFFLYNVNAGCSWPRENNEIDIEMTGNSKSIYFTTHHPDTLQPWHYGENFEFEFDPHIAIHKYAIEWEPGIIRWFVNDELAYTQKDDVTDNLMYPMAILMNLWASDAEDWVGVWNPEVLPQNAKYDYVKYFKYDPNDGNSGTNNNFKLEWEDHFEVLDTSRWVVSDFDKLLNSYCTFRSMNVKVSDGLLILNIDNPQPTTTKIPVTFSVNTNDLTLKATDFIYVNGTFNDWCGTCEPMTKENGVWRITLDLAPGKYEYLYTLNDWQQIGGAPLGSMCDAAPCDEFANYGVVVSESSPAISVTNYCWNSCLSCYTTSSKVLAGDHEKRVVKIFDLMGREVEYGPGQILIYLFSDGSVNKIFNYSW